MIIKKCMTILVNLNHLGLSSALFTLKILQLKNLVLTEGILKNSSQRHTFFENAKYIFTVDLI